MASGSDTTYFYEWDSLLRDFPEDALATIAEHLMTELHGRNYRALGGKLGYSVVTLDMMSSGSFPALALLKDWKCGGGRTLRCLKMALEEIGRFDIVDRLDVLRKREITLMGVIYSTDRRDKHEVKEIVCGRSQLWQGLKDPLKRFSAVLSDENQQTDYIYFQLLNPQTRNRSWLNECIQYQGMQIDVIQLNQNNNRGTQFQPLNEFCEIDSKNKTVIRLLSVNINSLNSIECLRHPIQEVAGQNQATQNYVKHDWNYLRPQHNEHLRCSTGQAVPYEDCLNLYSNEIVSCDDHLRNKSDLVVPPGDQIRRHTVDFELSSCLYRRNQNTDKISLHSDCGESLHNVIRSASEPAKWYTSNTHIRKLFARYPELEHIPAFHPNLESRNSEIQQVFQPYLCRDGFYLLHSSSSSTNPIKLIISVTFRGSILNFIINETRRSSCPPSSGCLVSSPGSSGCLLSSPGSNKYFLFKHHEFSSIAHLIEHYTNHRLELRKDTHNAVGPLLRTLIPSHFEYRNKF